jgi:hypothetical protein
MAFVSSKRRKDIKQRQETRSKLIKLRFEAILNIEVNILYVLEVLRCLPPLYLELISHCLTSSYNYQP